jgi:trans-aconitate methyltransferase
MYRGSKANPVGPDITELTDLVQRHASNGHILVVGCGTGAYVNGLTPDSFQSLLGLDISGEAISIARSLAPAKMCFEVADILNYSLQRNYDIILFTESIYYISVLDRKPLLQRLRDSLTSCGSIIVTIHQSQRYASIISMVRHNFTVIEEKICAGSGRQIIVFR